MALPSAAIEATATWQHLMSDPIPARFPAADGSLDEIALRGTFNLDLSDAMRASVLRESLRSLKPGGRLLLRTLVGERPVREPKLSGPASRVEVVPQEAEVLKQVEDAGFHHLYQLKFDAAPCFRVDDVPMRELQLQAWKPALNTGTTHVIYRGPFRQVTNAGYTYPRGRRITVAQAAADRLRDGPVSGQFVFLDGDLGTAKHCGSL